MKERLVEETAVSEGYCVDRIVDTRDELVEVCRPYIGSLMVGDMLAQVAGAEPAKQAAEWMAANVPYFSTTAKPGAPNFKAWFDDWNRRNFPNGTATRPLTPAEILASVPMTVDSNGNLVPVSSTTGGGSTTTTGGGGSSSTGSGSTGGTTPIVAGIDNTLLYAGAAGLVALILLMRK
jgi:uncharacterized membrane protein YgcG